MKKKHSSGSLDPTKLVVGIGILAVIAVAAGLLSSGVGSLQGSVARSSRNPVPAPNGVTDDKFTSIKRHPTSTGREFDYDIDITIPKLPNAPKAF